MDAKPGNDDADSGWLIDEDLPAEEHQADSANAAPWRILIVDDDVDVHVVTKFSLSNTNFQGRRLSFLHAYNGAEALAVLRNNHDIAIVLLDVIMETNHAGLQVARQIREQLHNHLVRIILRTGQPGQALEHSIIVDYDINDFWCKTDLTTRKLFTTVITSLRTYASLAEAEQRLVHASAALARAHAAPLHIGLRADGAIDSANDGWCALVQAPREQLLGLPLSGMLAQPQQALFDALTDRQAWAGDLTVHDRTGASHALKALLISTEQDPLATLLLSAASPQKTDQHG
ncbi:response regulator [Janthinobacterium agaricidamnosum]|uniref:Response regulator n=1 Tax=Janthinobacterium agaricidamnosum NBRC 102515 = DSM 9628 TaxID=1349767 RepID=W0V0Y9_9BURK|nr:response regulator [Janthinobacterium agaricidamnosum]CDG82484.1 response regulator [Janthinobacterium agaricidamnosum NBRC 102515 = DSM 9628]